MNPSPTERVLRALGHASIGAAGVYAWFVDLPGSLFVATEPWQLVLWIAFMVAGLIAAAGVLAGRLLWEYSSLPFMAGGVLIYVVALLNAVAVNFNSAAGVGVFLVAALAAYLGARWWGLDRLLRHPLRDMLRARKRRGDPS